MSLVTDSRHPSHNQTTSLPPLIDRTTKTTYKLRQQPKLDYRLLLHLPNYNLVILSVGLFKT